MADELKQLAQMIKNSADTRYAKKDEATGGGVVVSYEGGKGGDIKVNSHPVVSYISEADLNAKITNKVAELALIKSEPRVLIQTVVKWNMTTPSSRGAIQYKESSALSGDRYMQGLAYVEPKNWLITGTKDSRKLMIHDADTYALIKEQTLPYEVSFIVSSYDGKRLLIFCDEGHNYADIYELNEATTTYEKKYRLPSTTKQGTINHQGDKIVVTDTEGDYNLKLLSYSLNETGGWEQKSIDPENRYWRGIMIHQELLYAFTNDGKLWRGTYIDGVIGTMEEQVCDIPTDKDSEYYTQAYMTMDGSIIYKTDKANDTLSQEAGKVYMFAKQDDDSWKLITSMTSRSSAKFQRFGIDMCMNADNSKVWVAQYTDGVVDRFDIAKAPATPTYTLSTMDIDGVDIVRYEEPLKVIPPNDVTEITIDWYSGSSHEGVASYGNPWTKTYTVTPLVENSLEPGISSEGSGSECADGYIPLVIKANGYQDMTIAKLRGGGTTNNCKSIPIEPKLEFVKSETLDANSTDPFGDSSLKHFYKLNGDVNDSVGDANFYTEGIIVYEDAKYEKGAKLNNLGEMYIQGNVFRNDGTVNMWVRLTQHKENNTLFTTHNVDETSQFVNTLYCMGDGKIQIAGRGTVNDAFTRYITFDEVIPLNQLTMLTMTKTDNKIEVYKNGVLVGKADKVSFDTNSFKTHFGHNSNDDNADGTTFDHLQIFNRVLTPEEVTKLFNAKVQ